MAKRIRPYSENKLVYSQIIALIGVLLVAAILRFYRIADLTEFLGDQGRTGMEILRDWRGRTLPLVGPTVLSGEYLGPAFYYIMAPAFILGRFHPLSAALWTATIGVAAVGVLWWIGKELWGWPAAAMVAFLWAVSPQIVSSDRVLWEPNLIPFFAFSFVLGVLKMRKRASFLWGVVTGSALGIIIQLQYPAFLFFALTLVAFIEVWLREKKLSGGFVRAIFGLFTGFIIVTLPFVIYESARGFSDIFSVFGNFLAGGQAPLAKRQILSNILDYSSRVMRRVVPFPGGWETVSLLVLLAISIIKRSFWTALFVMWFLAGVTAIAFYRGVVFDHYLFFVLPVPFLLMGYLLSMLEKRTNIWIPLLFVAVIVVYQLSKTDITSPGPKDIGRVSQAAGEILRESAGQPFSFGLIASRSFLDFHYRYFFLLSGREAVPYQSQGYQKLFLVCEGAACPTSGELAKTGSAQLICFDPHCSGTYPSVWFKEWKFLQTTDVLGARIYLLERL